MTDYRDLRVHELSAVLAGAEKKRIVVGHPFWGRGGAEIAAMRLIQALLDEYQVDVVTRGGWSEGELNQASGTRIPLHAVRVRYPPLSGWRIGGAFWLALFYRFCRQIATEYDLCISAGRVIDWGAPAVHFLADVAWNPDLQRKFASPELIAREGRLRGTYWKLAAVIRGDSGRDPTQHDLFVANSHWTAAQSTAYCRNELKVIYPPVPETSAQPISWVERENAFVCLGRIAEEKEVDEVIAILDRVRIAYPHVRLYIVGNANDGIYARTVLGMCRSRRDWITVTGGLYGTDKDRLLASCRYGISACRREAFGIATAEMVDAGMIPFVPSQGGQMEIVNDPAVTYTTTEEAVEKIGMVLGSTTQQLQLQDALLAASGRFGVERFRAEVKALVRDALG